MSHIYLRELLCAPNAVVQIACVNTGLPEGVMGLDVNQSHSKEKKQTLVSI